MSSCGSPEGHRARWGHRQRDRLKLGRRRDSVDLIDDLVLAWKKPPVIVRELANSQLLKALGSDSSATVRMTAVLRSLTTSAADLSLDSNYSDGTKLTKNAKKKKKAADKKRKRDEAAAEAESEESEESDVSEEFMSEDDEDDQFGMPCHDDQGRIFQKCKNCSFFSKFGVCRYYHADAPAGTTGAKGKLNKKSFKKLTKLGAFRTHRRGR
jgi:hypothetical protein